MKASKRRLLALTMLSAMAFSCVRAGPSSEDIAATVNAVSTSVQQTLVAQTPPAISTVLLPTNTPLPPSPTAPLPATPTQFSPPSPTLPADLSRLNGPLIHALHLSNPPRIDGNLGEWTLYASLDQVVYRPENWSGPEDQNGVFAVGCDSQNLYLVVQLLDDRHVQTQHGELLYRGDSLELLLDADLRGDFNDARLSADDFQLGLSPGSLIAETAEAYLWFPTSRQGTPAGVQVAAQQYPTTEGFWLEAAIPWSLFGVTSAPGNRYGFALSSSDNDTPSTAEQQSMVSTVSTRRLTNPTTWGTLVLDN